MYGYHLLAPNMRLPDLRSGPHMVRQLNGPVLQEVHTNGSSPNLRLGTHECEDSWQEVYINGSISDLRSGTHECRDSCTHMGAHNKVLRT